MSLFSSNTVFDWVVLGVHVGYIAVVFGILQKEPELLSLIDYWVKVFVGIFLIYRFNAYFPAKFTDFDRRVVFSAGMFMIVTTVINVYFARQVEMAKKKAKFAYDRVETELTRGLSSPTTSKDSL